MDENNLILLTLDLNIPNLWENGVVKNFPESTFTIKNASPLGEDYFSGLLKITNSKFNKLNNYLKKNYPLVSLDVFHSDSGIFHFSTPDTILPKLLQNSKSILSWPVNFMEEFKRVKFILKDRDIEKIMIPLEKNKIEVEKFSKTKMNFDLKEVLTPKQKEILTPSLDNGYYDFPKKISLNKLSKKVGLSPSTLCVHLQKIESKILNSNYAEFLF